MRVGCCRLALERRLRELVAQEADAAVELCTAQGEKEAVIAEARRRRALRNSLTRYAGKVEPASYPVL